MKPALKVLGICFIAKVILIPMFLIVYGLAGLCAFGHRRVIHLAAKIGRLTERLAKQCDDAIESDERLRQIRTKARFEEYLNRK